MNLSNSTQHVRQYDLTSTTYSFTPHNLQSVTLRVKGLQFIRILLDIIYPPGGPGSLQALGTHEFDGGDDYLLKDVWYKSKRD